MACRPRRQLPRVDDLWQAALVIDPGTAVAEREHWRTWGTAVGHLGHLGAQCGQPGHVRVELSHAPAQQLLGRLARTHAGIANLPQPQPEPLATLNEPHPVQRATVVARYPAAVRAGGGSRPARS